MSDETAGKAKPKAESQDSPQPAGSANKLVSADQGSTLSTIKNLWPYIWPSERPDLKSRVLLALATLVVAKVVTVFSPYFFAWASDALTGKDIGQGWPAFVVAPIALILSYNVSRVLAVAFNQLRDGLFARVGQYAVRQIANITFVHLHRLSLRFHLARRTGGLSRVIERGTKGIESIVRFTILNGIPTILEFLIMAGVIWYQFGLPYVIVVAVMIIAYVWFTVTVSNWRISIRREMNESDTQANSKAVDSLLNYETVKYFGNEELESRRYDESMARYEAAATRTWTSVAWLNFGQTVILGIGMAVCMIMSGLAVQAGTQTIGDFVLINALLMQISIPLNLIGYIYREIRQGLADLEAMFELLMVDQEVKDKPGAPALQAVEGSIRFEGVKFSYDPARPILKGIDFEVPTGKTIAIVGPSGAGKSTISRLLFRFYDVTGGKIVVDGQDIRDVTQESLRHAIGMVPQDTVLFNDTIAYNIRYGRPNATDEEVREAARMAQIDAFIEGLPQGYDSEVGERGLKLSGGEKQRVAIARTILKAPPILILDEATSALDTQTERGIQAALDQVSKNRTTLVIAHRLSTVVDADEILVLKAGQVVERGTHAALLASEGLYASMWASQREADEAEERLRRAREADKQGFISRGPRAGEETVGA